VLTAASLGSVATHVEVPVHETALIAPNGTVRVGCDHVPLS
jgi:hypothetical protein